jgi:histone deacetylase complex regulatory component SIN3
MLRLPKEHRPDLWSQFEGYITEYRTPPRDLDRFHAQVKELLKDEPDLYSRFEEFFPKKSGGQETEGQGENNAT